MDILSLCRRMVMLFFCMACGFCAAKGGVMDTQSNKKLSALVVNVANPMQILASALTGERLLSAGQTLRLAGLIALIYLALIALSFPAVRLLRVRDAERGLYRFMFIFSNTGFLGYPVVESLLGGGAAFYVTIFVLFFQLFCWSYGASLMRGAARRASGFSGRCCGSRASRRRLRHSRSICPAGSRPRCCTRPSNMSAISQAPSSC